MKARKIEQEYPQTTVKVWRMDEHRLGLKPVLRRVWVPRGEQPIANHSFQDLDESEQVLFEQCQVILKQPFLIKPIVSFYWWPKKRTLLFRCNRNRYYLFRTTVQPTLLM